MNDDEESVHALALQLLDNKSKVLALKQIITAQAEQIDDLIKQNESLKTRNIKLVSAIEYAKQVDTRVKAYVEMVDL